MLIEISTFRLAPGVGDDEFLAADEVVQQEFVYQQPGLVRRTIARGADGSWAVITMWGAAEYAEAAAEKAEGNPVWRAFRSAIDEGSLTVERYETLD